MIATLNPLTLDDLEALAYTNGGTIEPTPTGYRLVGTLVGGVRRTFVVVTHG